MLHALSLAVAMTAQAGSSGPVGSPYFFIEGADAEVDRLPLESSRVDVQIAGVIADVTVRQRYRNRGSRAINTTYVFPGSTRAAVHGLVLRVGDRTVHAQIRERERAAREFERAKAEGK